MMTTLMYRRYILGRGVAVQVVFQAIIVISIYYTTVTIKLILQTMK